MPAFTGKLNANKIFAAIYNMIISQMVDSGNIKGTYSQLVDSARVDGTLYGDTKLYYATDCLKSSEWGNDAEAENLLKLDRPEAPKCQAIQMDVFRQIRLTVDNYLTKQAWATEGAFSSFNSVMLQWIRDTKKVYDSTTYNTFIGTCNPTVAAVHEIKFKEADYPSLGQGLGEVLADTLVNLRDTTRDFNDYGYLRSYEDSDLKFIWNAKYVNAIKKIDLPTLFHKEDLIDKFAENVLPSRFFGTINGITVTTATTKTRSLTEQVINGKDYFAGDKIPAGTALVTGGSITVPSYEEDENVICKIIHRDSVPYMSAFEVGTSFFNPRSLTENNYLTFGHNTLEYLKDKPFITVRKDVTQ